MTKKKITSDYKKTTDVQSNKSPKQLSKETAVPLPLPSLQKTHLSSQNVQTLQRTIGNQALRRLSIQRKMTLGPVGDKYEQEADTISKQVVGNLNKMSSTGISQRQEDQEEVQMKPISSISSLQRQEDEEDIQLKPHLQRQEDEELQAKSLVQRQEEEEEIQTNRDPISAGGELNGDVETAVTQAKSSGLPMADNVRKPMENAFNVDFSHIKIHTGGQSDTINRSLSARAFTSGQDIFFRNGEYNPGNTGGQELIAHELTHTIQQGATTQRKEYSPQTTTTVHHTQRNTIQLKRSTEAVEADAEKLKNMRTILSDLHNRRWAKAIAGYQNRDITYSKSGWFGRTKFGKWTRGLSKLNPFRKTAKALIPDKETKDLTDVLDTISTAGEGAANETARDKFTNDSIKHAAPMAEKIAHYLIQALPKTTLHQGIKENMIGNVPTVDDSYVPKALLMMGGPGSGKSSIVNRVLPDTSDWVVADPDAVKGALPQYQAGVKAGDENIAGTVHEESKEVTNSLVEQTIESKRNLLYDTTGGNAYDMQSKIRELKKAGYETFLVMAHITLQEGLNRVRTRAQETGRSVPEDIVKNIYNLVPTNFIKTSGTVDHAYLFDNLVGKEEAPKLLWENTDGAEVKSEQLQALKLALGLGVANDQRANSKEQEEYMKKLDEKTFGMISLSGQRVAEKAEKWLVGKDKYDKNPKAKQLAEDYGLTLAEVAAIAIYTADDYKYINPVVADNEGWLKAVLPKVGNSQLLKSIKEQGVTDEHVQQAKEEGLNHAMMVSSGLAKLPAWKGMTYRGLGLTMNEFQSKYPANGTAVMEAFTSTSLKDTEAKSWAGKGARDESKKDPVGIFLRLNLANGKDIMDFSNTQKEEEILVLPGAKFSVDSIVETEKFHEVTINQTE